MTCEVYLSTRKTVDRSGHRTCGQEANAKEKAKREVMNMLMDGLGKVTNKLMDGGKRQIGQKSRQWMSATAWNAEEPIGGIIEFNSIEGCCSENPRGGEKQKASESDERRRCRVRRHRNRAPTPKPTRSSSESSATSEMSMSSEGSWTKSFCEMERWFALQTDDEANKSKIETELV